MLPLTETQEPSDQAQLAAFRAEQLETAETIEERQAIQEEAKAVRAQEQAERVEEQKAKKPWWKFWGD